MKYDHGTIRELERQSIQAFITDCGQLGLFTGKLVLDVGCGQQPYRSLVEVFGGDYTGFDRPDFAASTVSEPVGPETWLTETWDVVMSTQVIQYVDYPLDFLVHLYGALKPEGSLVITWPTCWDEIEESDRWRFTLEGMVEMLHRAGFYSVKAEQRAAVELGGFRFSLGGGAWAKK